jgi:hypothetical protein
MKRALFLVAVLFLMSNLAWAQAAGTAPSPVADPRAGGNCQLPDLAGLSPGQRAAAAINAGLEMTFVDSPGPGLSGDLPMRQHRRLRSRNGVRRHHPRALLQLRNRCSLLRERRQPRRGPMSLQVHRPSMLVRVCLEHQRYAQLLLRFRPQ